MAHRKNEGGALAPWHLPEALPPWAAVGCVGTTSKGGFGLDGLVTLCGVEGLDCACVVSIAEMGAGLIVVDWRGGVDGDVSLDGIMSDGDGWRLVLIDFAEPGILNRGAGDFESSCGGWMFYGWGAGFCGDGSFFG